MTSSRALILLIAVYFQSSSCARLKRKHTQVALANGVKRGVTGGPNDVLVSESLIDERDKIHGFMIEEEARVKAYAADLANTKVNLRNEKDHLKSEEKLWKIWNWRVWSDKLKGIEAEIARLQGQAQRLENLIISAQDTINNFKDAKQWAHNAAQSAIVHEKMIADLQKQVEGVQANHLETVQAYEIQEKQAKEDGEEKLKVFEADLATLTADIAEQQAVLDSLNDGQHDLQIQMKTTRENMQKTIDGHSSRIDHLTAAILDNERETAEAENVREQSKEQYEATLTTLREGRAALEEQRTNEHDQMVAAQNDLDRETEEGTARIEKLKRALNEQLKALSADIESRRDAMHKQKLENDAKLLALKATYTDRVTRITQQINDFVTTQNDSRAELDALRKGHLAETSDNSIVSEALHKAKEDLEFKIKVQEDAKAAASASIERFKRLIVITEAELAHEDKWYKFWNWEVWSRTKTDLRNLIQKHKGDLATQEGQFSHCVELISRLSTQIESKLNAKKLAEVEEVAIDELENQIVDKRNEKKEALEEEKTERALAKESGEDQVRTFESMVRELKAQQSTARATLDRLEDGTHDEHQKLADAREALSGIIAVHNKAIQNLTAAISINKNNENEVTAAEQNDVADHEGLILTLKNDKDQMIAHRTTAAELKETEEGTLATLEANHQASVEDLKGNLGDMIEDLQETREDLKEDYQAQKLEKEKVLQSEKEAHHNEIASLKLQVDKLTESKAEAQEDLNEIQNSRSK